LLMPAKAVIAAMRAPGTPGGALPPAWAWLLLGPPVCVHRDYQEPVAEGSLAFACNLP
jgi:hypothetical protein